MAQRVTMVVDNGVRGDSRVVKSALSAAAAGYDVTVIGHGPREDFQIGRVLVQLFPGTPAATAGSLARWSRQRMLQGAALKPYEVKAHHRRMNGPDRPGPLGRAGAKAAVAVRWRLNRWARTDPGQSAKMVEFARRHPQTAAALGLWDHLDPWLASIVRDLDTHILDTSPDLVHCHDYRCLPAAVLAVEKLRASDHDVALVYDAHEYVPGLVELGEPRRQAAVALERRYLPFADGVITVSDDLARRISEEHSLKFPVEVVCNAPEVPGTDPGGPSLRARIGLRDDQPLLVYSGSVGGSRLLKDCVSSLVELPDAHLALIVSHPTSQVMLDLHEHAGQLGVADRLHLTRYVEPAAVVPFLRGVDVGLAPIKHTANVQDSLPTKTLEYLAAGVPQVVSDLRALAQFIRDTGAGEVFEAGSVPSLVAAIRKVLADPGSYRDAITPELVSENSWEVQAERLLGLYARLLPETAPVAPGAAPAPATSKASGVAILGGAEAEGLAAALKEQGLGVTHFMPLAGTDGSDPTLRFVAPEVIASSPDASRWFDEIGRDFAAVVIDDSWLARTRRTSHADQAADVGRLEATGATVLRSHLGDFPAEGGDAAAVARWLGVPNVVRSPAWLTVLPEAILLTDFAAPRDDERPRPAFADNDRLLLLELDGEPEPDESDDIGRLGQSPGIEVLRLRNLPDSLADALMLRADIVVLQAAASRFDDLLVRAVSTGALVVVHGAAPSPALPVVPAPRGGLADVVRGLVEDRESDRGRIDDALTELGHWQAGGGIAELGALLRAAEEKRGQSA